MICYMIQCHDNFEHVGRLLCWLYNEEDTFIISIDASSINGFVALKRYFELPNVSLGPRHYVTWGGCSVLQATLSSMRAALDKPNWEYFLNLSAYDVPLINRDTMAARLRALKSDGLTSFVADFGEYAVRPKVWFGNESGGRIAFLSAPSGAKFELYGQAVEFQRAGNISHVGFLPIDDPSLRASLDVTEHPRGKLLIFRPLYEYEAHFRKIFASNIPYRVGRQWLILHRAMCEQIHSSQIAQEIYHLLSRTFISDEAFFQTTLRALPGSLESKGIKEDNFRYHLGAAVRIHDGNYDEVSQSGSWFARKLDVSAAAGVIMKTDHVMKNGRDRFPLADALRQGDASLS